MRFDDYRELIERLLRAGYEFQTFSKCDSVTPTGPCVVLRHDIDFSPELAGRMAEWETCYGVSASYFVQTRSPLYNVVAQQSCDALAAIAAHGHDVGLHLDASIYQTFCTQDVAKETGILRLAVPGCLTAVISLHRPRRPLPEIRQWTSRVGIHTVYDAPWTTTFSYFADSGGTWAYGSPLDSAAFRERRNLQILVHPLWWLIPGGTPKMQLRNFADRAPEAVLRQLRESAVSFEV